jgi:hypothetical protein
MHIYTNTYMYIYIHTHTGAGGRRGKTGSESPDLSCTLAGEALINTLRPKKGFRVRA